MTAAQSQRGRTREGDVVKFLAKHGWSAIRAASGPVDVVANAAEWVSFYPPDKAWGPDFGDSERCLYVQVKSTSGGPYERFGPAERAAFLAAAARAGADAWLAWWPPHGQLAWIGAKDFPRVRQPTRAVTP